jgi:hypothetical protein
VGVWDDVLLDQTSGSDTHFCVVDGGVEECTATLDIQKELNL